MGDDAPEETHLRTAWHPVLVALLGFLLPADRWRVVAEYLLNREPRRIDAVILRATDPARPLPDDWRADYLRSVLDGLRPFTLVHFKGATDELERADALQVLSYVAQLMRHEDLEDPALVAVRVVAPRLSPRFATQLRKLGGSLMPTAMRGVHEGALHGFALRVVETSVAWDNPHEHLLYAVSPESIAHPERIGDLDARERLLYYHLVQNIRMLAKDPTWRATMKDAPIVELTANKTFEQLVAEMPREMWEWLYPPEKRLEGISVEQRLAGLAPEQRLAGLAPEQRLAGLAPDHAVLVLPVEALRALDPAYLATLPADVQATVRERLTRTP